MPTVPDWFSLFSPDKITHFGAYGVFALLLSACLRAHAARRPALWAVLFASAYGVLMEILQGVSGTGRSYDPVDMVANLLGALLGGVVFLLYLRTKRNGASQR